jgi:nucleoside-diphosphate-sugar epimerase
MIKGIIGGYYFNIGGRKYKRSMVLAEDVAKFICKACEIGGVYNLTDGCHPSFVELSNYISFRLGKGNAINLPLWLAKILAICGDFLGDKSPFDSIKLKKITSDLTFDDSKAREAFGWDPTPVLEGFNIFDINS